MLVVAFGVSRSCGAVGDEISQDEAVTIARREIDFDADNHQIRLFKKGLDSRPYWAVSLYDGPRTAPTRCQIVQIDAANGAVVAVDDC